MNTNGPESIAQPLIKRLSNVSFIFFVLVVLIFTVFAVTYQPPDPWQEPREAFTAVFRSVTNATFRTDDSVVRTGEDFNYTDRAERSKPDQVAINETTLFTPALERWSADCDPQQTKINCSDPSVLVALEKFNLLHFPNLQFFAYGKPVRGAKDDECDVAWRFRSLKEKSWRTYRDYRRFTLILDRCEYSVNRSLRWHSGKNATPFKPIRGVRPRPESLPLNPTVLEEAEVIKDSVPAAKSNFRYQDHFRYLHYSRSNDHCKTMNQYLWSFLCALGEAQYLNRTLIMDLNLCLSSLNNPGHDDEDGKDFRFYFDFAHLKDAASVAEQEHFFKEMKQWNQDHPADKVTVKEVRDREITPMQLRSDKSTIISRKFEGPDSYWFRVCEGETEKVIQRPWHLIWKSKRIMDIVNSICGQMEWDFDAVHVVRGDKAKNKEQWPNLESDTSVDSLIEKLRDKIGTSRNVYIATNEREPGYFNPLKEVYNRARTLDDFSSLWAKDSLWYNQTLELTGGKPVDFDGYMRIEVDTEVTYRARKKIETFGSLTDDCKDGINSC